MQESVAPCRIIGIISGAMRQQQDQRQTFYTTLRDTAQCTVKGTEISSTYYQ